MKLGYDMHLNRGNLHLKQNKTISSLETHKREYFWKGFLV